MKKWLSRNTVRFAKVLPTGHPLPPYTCFLAGASSYKIRRLEAYMPGRILMHNKANRGLDYAGVPRGTSRDQLLVRVTRALQYFSSRVAATKLGAKGDLAL